MKRITKIFVVICTVLMIFTSTVSAVSIPSNNGYTYNSEQEVITAPVSHELIKSISGTTLGVDSLNDISDIAVYNDELYILEKKQGKIFVVDKKFTLLSVLGEGLNLNSPEGFYINSQGYIYIADTGNRRILKVNNNGELLKELLEPKQENSLSTVEFIPQKIVVDKGERLYIVVSDETNGIYQMDINGKFLGFFGSVPVVPSITELIWRFISTKEQKSRMKLFIPTEYSSIDIDKDGFIYTTVATNTDSEMRDYIKSKGSDKTLAPIRRLNPKNIDVLIRKGSIPPAGDLIETVDWKADSGNASRFIDISVSENGIYSALDSTRGRVFTYDKFGSLLYVFGNIGNKKDEFSKPTSLSWWGEDIAVVDYDRAEIKVYSLTEYSRLINNAVYAQQSGDYDTSNNCWNKVLEKHSGSDLAYIGIGKNELRQGNYVKAMKLFKKADDTVDYSKAFKKYRQVIGTKATGIAVCVIIIVIAAIFIIKKIVKKHKKSEIKKNPVYEGVKYGFYIMRHPFDGFWDMQFENRGNLKSATIILVATVVLNLISTFATGYLFAPNKDDGLNIVIQGILAVLLPFGLWCVANWSVTSLMNGSGTFKYIYMYSCYALTPFLISTPLLTVLSNCLSLDEVALYSIVKTLFFIWVGFLLFVGTLVVHQYLAGRTIATIIVIIVAMGIIVFLFLLCVTIVQQMTDFIGLLGEEINLRL